MSADVSPDEIPVDLTSFIDPVRETMVPATTKSQSIKQHILRQGYEKYVLKLKDKIDRAGVIIEGVGVMHLQKIRVAKLQGKNNEFEVELFFDMNAKEVK